MNEHHRLGVGKPRIAPFIRFSAGAIWTCESEANRGYGDTKQEAYKQWALDCTQHPPGSWVYEARLPNFNK